MSDKPFEQVVTMSVDGESFEIPLSVVLSTYADVMYFSTWRVYRFVQINGATEYQINNGCCIGFYENEDSARAGAMLHVMNNILKGEDGWQIKIGPPRKLTHLFSALLSSGITDVS